MSFDGQTLPARTSLPGFEHDRAIFGLTGEPQVQRAISADVYGYLAQVSARTPVPDTPDWLGTMAHNPHLTVFSD